LPGLAAYPKARSEPVVIFPEGLLNMLQNRFGTASMRFNLDGRPWSSAQFLMSGTGIAVRLQTKNLVCSKKIAAHKQNKSRTKSNFTSSGAGPSTRPLRQS
jgi:hypothetical protein